MRDALVAELASLICRCGRPKARRNTFCRGCYYSLSPAVRSELYLRIRHGYERAHAAAIAELDGRRP